MFISTLSKHLPAVIRYRQTRLEECMLEVVHLTESARYHMDRLDRLTSGDGAAPPHFQSGVDFSGAVLDSHWRIMASLIEFEAFLSAGKRCLDRAWCCLGERLGRETSKIRTLGAAVSRLEEIEKSTRKLLNRLPYFSILKVAWDGWGQQLANLRNYVEHQAPLGGRSFGFTEQFEKAEAIKIFIPDEIPRGRENVPKRALTFNKQITANAYGHRAMRNLDELVGNLLRAGETLTCTEL